jgi:chorismate mutase/prephenate dehydratase
MTLDELRRHIDAIDAELLALLNRRADLVHKVGEVKRESGAEFYAPEREELLLRALARLNKELNGLLTEEAMRAIYREIMSASLAIEKPLTIAYLGPEHTWTHQAALQKFGASLHYSSQSSIADVFSEVSRGRADYGVVPIENSTEGAVSHTLDVFVDSDHLHICAQILLRIDHNLAGNGSIDGITQIFSHSQSLGQCRQWLREHLPSVELTPVSSNTRGAELAASTTGAAAICGDLAAAHYGLTILERSIQDIADNTTRFLVIGKTTSPPTGNDKTSVMFSIQDKAGALYLALEPFHRLKLSLSKIESRPSRRKAWEYFFFVDVEGHCEDTRLIDALTELRKHCSFVKILGSYPNNGPVAAD